MKLAILSRGPKLYSTMRLRQAAQARGHSVRVLHPLKFAISLERASPDLYYRNKPAGRFDAIIPRIGASVTYYGTTVVRQFEQMGVFTANSALSITHARDKLRSLQILSRHDIGIPATSFVSDRADVLPAIQRVGGAPVIIKLLEGTQGVGVILAENIKMAQAIVETLRSAQKNALIQKFVQESRGRDVRAFVVGDRVVAAMRRVATDSEFRSNLHRGGSAKGIKLTPEYEHTALRVAQILGLRVAGVDMLESSTGPQVMEVNACPGLEGIEAATGADVAGAIVEYIEDHVKFPEMDLRERLTVSAGYGVGELQIASKSELLGQTIGESGLRQQDIAVLTLAHGGKVIANPRDTRVIKAGDRLLCFGKLEAMRGLMVRPKLRRVPKLSRKDRDLAGGQTEPAARTPRRSKPRPQAEP